MHNSVFKLGDLLLVRHEKLYLIIITVIILCGVRFRMATRENRRLQTGPVLDLAAL